MSRLPCRSEGAAGVCRRGCYSWLDLLGLDGDGRPGWRKRLLLLGCRRPRGGGAGLLICAGGFGQVLLRVAGEELRIREAVEVAVAAAVVLLLQLLSARRGGEDPGLAEVRKGQPGHGVCCRRWCRGLVLLVMVVGQIKGEGGPASCGLVMERKKNRERAAIASGLLRTRRGEDAAAVGEEIICLLYTSPSPRDS